MSRNARGTTAFDGSARVAWLAAFLLACSIAGCLRDADMQCANGAVICPANTVCDVVHGTCVSPHQLTSCNGKNDGDDCSIDVPGDGICDRGVCDRLYCGDSRISGAEECDGQQLPKTDCMELGYYISAPLACRDDCTFDRSLCSQICGDGTRDAVEQCDGTDLGTVADCTDLAFYEPGPVSCNDVCRFNTAPCRGYCGDGKVSGPEYCEGAVDRSQTCVQLGFDRGSLACSDLCSPDLTGCRHIGWRPLPVSTAATLRAAWGSSADDIFIVGTGGTILHFDGTSWSAMPSGTSFTLNGIWGRGANDVYAVGSDPMLPAGIVLHYDGTAWTQLTPPQELGRLYTVWASAANDLYVAGEFAWHYDGSNWTKLFPSGGDPYGDKLTPSGYKAVWGFAAADVYFLFNDVGVGLRIHHYDGTSWSIAFSDPSIYGGEAIWGSAPNDVWIAGESSRLLHYNGLTWTSVPGLLPSFDALALWGTAADDIFAVGAQGRVIYYDGVRWSALPSPSSATLFGVWGLSRDHVLAVGASATAFTYPGSAWNRTTTSSDLGGVSGTSSTDVYVASKRSSGSWVRYFNGVTWQDVQVTPAGSSRAAFAASTTDVFVVGANSPIVRGSGTNPGGWTVMSGGAFDGVLSDVHGSSASNVFAVGVLTDPDSGFPTDGVIYHYDGNAGLVWSTSAYAANGEWTASGVWAAGPNDAYVVGATAAGDGVLLHHDGNTWTQVSLPAMTPGLLGIRGRAANDIYAVGELGTVLHYDGNTWSAMDSGTTMTLSQVSIAAVDVFVVGTAGVMLHFDGAVWNPVQSGTTFSLRGAFTSGSSTFVTGDGGTLFELRRTASW